MNYTEEQILALAPDDASKKSGKGLAGAANWVSFGANSDAIWGECQGSGSKPYQTQVDLNNIAFKCSCPSRKFPCKHGLGLMLFYSKDQNHFSGKEIPAWVSEWLGKRTEKAEKIEEKVAKPVDEVAQAKRQQARVSKVKDGIEELLLWIKDIIRNGAMHIPEKPYAFWNGMAKRMVDAQAPGLATMVNGLGEIPYFKEGWQHIFLDRLLAIYLLIEGYRNIETLEPAMQAEIRALIGFTQSQSELKAQTGIKDNWCVIARQVTEEERLIVEKFWLYGTQSQQYALILQFTVNSQARELALLPGSVIEAELVFYNADLPLRALLKEQTATRQSTALAGHTNWEAVIEAQVKWNERNPFITELPFVVNLLRPVNHNEQWWLQDTDNNMMQMVQPTGLYELLALCGGQHLPMVVLGKEHKYQPVGVWYNNEYKAV